MVQVNCPYCGTPLQKTNWDSLWCPNHGKIDEDKEEPDSDENYSDYIG